MLHSTSGGRQGACACLPRGLQLERGVQETQGKTQLSKSVAGAACVLARTTVSIIQVHVVTWDSGRQRKGLEPGEQAAFHQGQLWPGGPPGGFSNSMGLGPSRAEESWAVPSLDIPGDHLGGRGQGERAATPPELPLLLSQEAARCAPESQQNKVNSGSTVNRIPKAMVKWLLAM